MKKDDIFFYDVHRYDVTGFSRDEIKKITLEMRPLDNVINGFRISFDFIYIKKNDKEVLVYIPFVHPNYTFLSFYFSTLEEAVEFCKQYKNHHASYFWQKRWSKLYSKDFVEKKMLKF